MVVALLGPVKNGILPEKLETAEFARWYVWWGCAMFLRILIGTYRWRHCCCPGP